MSAPPRERAFAAAGPDGAPLRLAYTDWGDAANPRALVCVHGLTRNARDFDALAAALSPDHRVICADVVGRGGSDWLGDPAGYAYPTYIAHLRALLAHLGLARVDFIGASMGGLIGMMLAAGEDPPVARLVMNDIGPFIPGAALARIGDYVGADPRFDDVDALEAYLRSIYPGFGPMTDAQWRAFAGHSGPGAARRRGRARLRSGDRLGVQGRAGRGRRSVAVVGCGALRCPRAARRRIRRAARRDRGRDGPPRPPRPDRRIPRRRPHPGADGRHPDRDRPRLARRRARITVKQRLPRRQRLYFVNPESPAMRKDTST